MSYSLLETGRLPEKFKLYDSSETCTGFLVPVFVADFWTVYDGHSGVTSYGALGHVPPLELVQVVIFTLHVCSVAFRCSQKRS